MLRSAISPKEQWLLIAFASAVALGAASVYVHHHYTAPSAAVLTALPIAEDAPVPAAPPIPADPPPPLSISTMPLEAPIVTKTPIAVSVAGAVEYPDVYEFIEPARVRDLLEAAGGPADDADLSDINLAARLIDATTLVVPRKAAVDPGGVLTARRSRTAPPPINPPQYTISGWNPAVTDTPERSTSSEQSERNGGPSGSLIDLNTATLTDLENLPGIGPKLGAQIVAYREKSPFQSVEDLDNVPGIGAKRLDALRALVTVGSPTR